MSGSLEELRHAEREAAINKLLIDVDPYTPWINDLRKVAGAFADELEKFQTRPEPGYRVVLEREDA